MTTIVVETRIAAPIEVCFDLARDVEAHLKASSRRFVDEMVKGAFRSLRHIHEFDVDGDTVVMRDILTWRSPLGPLGVIADKCFVESHMRRSMVQKQSELKAYAERSSRKAAEPAAAADERRRGSTLSRPV